MRFINSPRTWAGAGYIFTGEHDAAVMHNSATINLEYPGIGTWRGCSQVFLFLLCLHVPRLQPSGP